MFLGMFDELSASVTRIEKAKYDLIWTEGGRYL